MSEKFEQLFHFPTLLICVIAPDGTFHQTNIAQKHILGWDPQDLIGQPVADFVFPEDAERTYKEFSRLNETGGLITDFRNRCLHKDGGYRWISWSGSMKDGLIFSIGTDVTAQLDAEAKFHASQAEMALFFESLPLISWISNTNGQSVYYNKTWYAYTGLKPENLTQKSAQEVTHPEDRSKVLQKFSEAIKAEKKFEIVLRLKRHDGEYRWHLARSVPVKDAQGQVLRWIGTSTDIHDQMTAKQRLHSLFMKAPACITINSGPEHVYEFSNELNNRLIGMSDFIGKPLKEVMAPLDVQSLIPLCDQVYQSGEPLFFDEVPIEADWGDTGIKETRFFASVIQPTQTPEAKVDGIMTFAVDVTSQVKARHEMAEAQKKAEAASRAKSEFLANMSHEIRTPLSAIIGYSELVMEMMGLPMEAQDHLKRIQSNGRQLLNIIGNILDLSKIEAKGFDLVITEFSLREFLEDLFSAMASLVERKRLEFDFHIGMHVPHLITTDANLLRQILQNLLGNAIKFTDRGFVILDINTGADGRLEFRVKDSGIGISSEHKSRLFQAFTQADNSLSRTYGGTGLGLVLSRKFANLLLGDVQIEKTEPGRGTTFLLTVQNQRP